MISEAFTGLINNTALLLALALLYEIFPLRTSSHKRWMEILTGVIIGVIGVAVMVSHWELVPGVIFDTRSILLSITGLFFGVIPTVIAVVITALYRLLLGGVGTWTGVSVIVFAAGVGLAWAHRFPVKRHLSITNLFTFGVVVHIGMLLLMLTLPETTAREVISKLAVLILVIFPVGTVLLGEMLVGQFERHETVSSLRENESRMRQIVQGIPVLLNAFDENFNIVAWNSESERITGYSAAEVIGNPNAWELMYPDPVYRRHVMRLYAKHRKTEAPWEVRVHCKEGSDKTLACWNVSNRVKIPGWQTWGVAVDVADRVRAMSALRDAEERLRLALRAANIGLWDWDLRNDQLYYSPEWKRQLGYAEDELTDRFSEWESRLHPDDAERAASAAENYIERSTPNFEQDFRLRHRDGSYRTILAQSSLIFDDAGKPARMLGAHVDITDRVQAEEALRASEAHLRAILSSTPIILLAIDQDGIITMLQGYGLSLLGVDGNQWIGHSIFESDIGEASILLWGLVQKQMKQALAGEDVESLERIGQYDFAIRYSPLRSKTGEVVGAIAVATDITERLDAERLRVELEKEQEIIALRERFIATASHDFRSPLTTIRMATSMLETYIDRMPIERRNGKLQQINEQVDRMTKLLDNALTVSKAHAGKIEFRPEVVDLQAFVRSLWDEFVAQAEPTHRLDFNMAVDLQQVTLDPKLMYRVLVNLLSNALKYSPEDGLVRFEVTCEGDSLVFRVSDNGIGIPSDDIKHLFEPFFRATNTGVIEGTGLGLSIVTSFVEAHSGRVTVESEVGEGTTFTVLLPIKSA